jgi:very-short-patch-repair endonuclease
MKDPGPDLVSALSLARRQDGALSYRQALAAGLTRGHLRSLVANGRWIRVCRGCFLVPDYDPVRGPVHAAQLVRPGSVACGITAARLLGFGALPKPDPGENIHLLMPPDAPWRRSPPLVLHRTPYRAEEMVDVRGLSATSPERTLVDILLSWDKAEAIAVADAALHSGRLPDLGTVRSMMFGRRGALSLGPWWLTVDGRAESPLETRLRLLLQDAGLAPEEVQYKVRDSDGHVFARLDLAWPSRRLCVEADGVGVHSEPAALLRDRHRQNALVNAGWHVLRFTWSDITSTPRAVISAVYDAFDRR